MENKKAIETWLNAKPGCVIIKSVVIKSDAESGWGSEGKIKLISNFSEGIMNFTVYVEE